MSSLGTAKEGLMCFRGQEMKARAGSDSTGSSVPLREGTLGLGRVSRAQDHPGWFLVPSLLAQTLLQPPPAPARLCPERWRTLKSQRGASAPAQCGVPRLSPALPHTPENDPPRPRGAGLHPGDPGCTLGTPLPPEGTGQGQTEHGEEQQAPHGVAEWPCPCQALIAAVPRLDQPCQSQHRARELAVNHRPRPRAGSAGTPGSRLLFWVRTALGDLQE